MKPCTHDLAEQETACAADGMCPICLANKLAAANRCLDAADALARTGTPSAESQSPAYHAIESLRNELAAAKVEAAHKRAIEKHRKTFEKLAK